MGMPTQETDIRENDEKSSKTDKTEQGMEKHGKSQSQIEANVQESQSQSQPRQSQQYVVPTGRVVVSTGRYVVPAGKVIIIVSPGRLSLVPTGRVLSPGSVK
ncbi:hypothetical protein Tco_0671360 [Tanacetum coccineum]